MYRVYVEQDGQWVDVFRDRDPLRAAAMFVAATGRHDGSADVDPAWFADSLPHGDLFERTDVDGVRGILCGDISPMCPRVTTYNLYRGDTLIESGVDYRAAVSWFIHSAGESETETQSAYYDSVRAAVRNGYCSDHRPVGASTVIVGR